MAKTWATKCCSGTYKNNYQLCCGIKVDKNLVPYTYTINILPPKVLQKVSEAELKEFGDILTKLDFSEFIQWDDFTNEQRGVKEPGWAILYSNTKIIYNSDIP